MKLEQSFAVDAPAEAVWGALTDSARVAEWLPGGALERKQEDAIDDEARTRTMQPSGCDTRGQGSARATVVDSLSPEGERTCVNVVTDATCLQQQLLTSHA